MPPLIDLVASDVADLLRQLDGRTITRFDGRHGGARTAGAAERRVEMTQAAAVPQRHRTSTDCVSPAHARHARAHGGALEPRRDRSWRRRGALPAARVLRVSGASRQHDGSAARLLFGVVLLVLELKVPSFGALGVGGTISLIVGSIMLTRDVPGVEVSYGVDLAGGPRVRSHLSCFSAGWRSSAAATPAVTGVEASSAVDRRAP